MQLYYYRQIDFKSGEAIPNFGDDLNPWLWNQLIPDFFKSESPEYFIGAGTLINDNLYSRLTNARKIIIFGTGVGYGKTVPDVDNRWSIYALRGPLSAKALQVDPELAVIDSGILVRRLFNKNHTKKWPAAYMPHVSFARKAGSTWKSICEDLGILFIDPRWPVEEVMTSVCETEILFTEAMHGAISAEAFCVPWIPVTTDVRILDFKWVDWCKSIGIEYEPMKIELKPFYQAHNILSNLGFPPKSSRVYSISDSLASSNSINLRILHGFSKKKAKNELARILRVSRPVRASRSRVEKLVQCLEEKLENIRSDFHSGELIR